MSSRVKSALYKGLVLVAAALIAYALNGCATSYEAAQLKYSTTKVDTATVVTPVTVTIPRDSAVISVVTDTTHVVIEERNKTSWVRLFRDKGKTRVEGGCDSATIAKNVLARVPQKQAIWGVDPSYKTWSERWKTATFVLFGLLSLFVGVTVFLRKFTVIPK